jgi:hypothetical protein
MKGHVRERGKGYWYAVLEARDPAASESVNGILCPTAKASAMRRLPAAS